MPVKIIRGNEHLRISYHVQRGTHFQFEVEGNATVNTYLVDAKGLDDFEAGDEFEVYAGQTNRLYHDDEADIPFTGPIWFIILNPHDFDVAIHYEVYV